MRRGSEQSDRLVAEVRTAVPLTEAERTALQSKLKARFGDHLAFRFVVDKSVLGGVYVRVGDKVIDGSVAGQLEALRRSIME
mgnify:CR=1 FL=1